MSKKAHYYTVNFLIDQEEETRCVTVRIYTSSKTQLGDWVRSMGNVTTSIRGPPSQNSRPALIEIFQ